MSELRRQLEDIRRVHETKLRSLYIHAPVTVDGRRGRVSSIDYRHGMVGVVYDGDIWPEKSVYVSVSKIETEAKP